MAKEIRLPQLGQTMEEGTIVNVLVGEGDKIEKGDVIFEIETDKATLEMESPAEGFVKRLLVKADETLPVNAPLLVIGEEDEEVSQEFLDGLAGSEGAAGSAETAEEKPDAKSGSDVSVPDSVKLVRLPQLGQTMEEGTIVNVMISEGDTVEKGDVIFEVETDKATLEMESPVAGVVGKVLVSADETLEVNAPLAVFGDGSVEITPEIVDALTGGEETAGPAEKGGAATEAPKQTPAPSVPGATPAPKNVPAAKAHVPAAVQTGGRIFASPRAKMTAAELGVDLSKVQGTGPVGRIVEADVKKAASTGTAAAGITTAGPAPQISFEPAAGSPKMGEKVAVSKFQKITAQKMVQSKRDIPCFYLSIKADVTEMVKLRASVNEQAAQSGGVKVSFNDFIIRAVALGLRKFPAMLGQLEGDYIQIADAVNVGLAVSVEDGLAAPLIRDADQKNLAQIADYAKGVIGRAKSNTLTADDVSGGSITVSNLGGFGIDSFIPIVVPGQGSILGVGKISDTCVPVDGNIMARKIMDMTISSDHKVVNGTDAAAFLGFVKQLLENPQVLI